MMLPGDTNPGCRAEAPLLLLGPSSWDSLTQGAAGGETWRDGVTRWLGRPGPLCVTLG